MPRSAFGEVSPDDYHQCSSNTILVSRFVPLYNGTIADIAPTPRPAMKRPMVIWVIESIVAVWITVPTVKIDCDAFVLRKNCPHSIRTTHRPDEDGPFATVSIRGQRLSKSSAGVHTISK